MTDVLFEAMNIRQALQSVPPLTPAIIHAASGPTVDECLDSTRDHYIIHNSCESIAWDIEKDLLQFPDLRPAIAAAACESCCLPPSRFWLDSGQRLLLAALHKGELHSAKSSLEKLKLEVSGEFSRSIVDVATGGLQQLLLLAQGAQEATAQQLPVMSVEEFLQKRTRLFLLESLSERHWSKAFTVFLTAYICRALDAALEGHDRAELSVIIQDGLRVVPSFVYQRLYAEGPRAGIKIYVTNE